MGRIATVIVVGCWLGFYMLLLGLLGKVVHFVRVWELCDIISNVFSSVLFFSAVCFVILVNFWS